MNDDFIVNEKQKQEFPTKEQIEAKRKEFRAMAIKPKEKINKRTPLTQFLLLIKSDIINAIKSGSSNQQIVKSIESVYSVKMSVGTFVNFCKSNNIKTKTRNKVETKAKETQGEINGE